VRSRTIVPMFLALVLVIGACGDDGVLLPTGATTASTTATTAATTVAPTATEPPVTQPPETTPPATEPPVTQPPETTPPTTEPPMTQPPETVPPTTESAPTALDTLRSFFFAAEDLDDRIRDAAAVFNAGLDSEAVTIDPAVQPVLDALDATPLRYMIPAGLSPELEVAVLAVFADLDSRISAMQGGFRSIAHDGNLEWGLDCLANGGASADRFPADLSRARSLAALEPVPVAAPDSEVAGVLMVRLEAIQGMNWGCESCGGTQYDTAIPVDWDGRTVLGGVEFEATFGGDYWDIMIHAC